MTAFLAKYFIPTSLTWWTGVAMLLSGIVMALANVIPALAVFVGPLGSIWSGQDSAALIAAGLTAIGLRASVSTAVAALASDATKKADIATIVKDVGATIGAATDAPKA